MRFKSVYGDSVTTEIGRSTVRFCLANVGYCRYVICCAVRSRVYEILY